MLWSPIFLGKNKVYCCEIIKNLESSSLLNTTQIPQRACIMNKRFGKFTTSSWTRLLLSNPWNCLKFACSLNDLFNFNKEDYSLKPRHVHDILVLQYLIKM